MKIPVKILVIDLFLFLLCIPGIIQIANKAALPFTIVSYSEALILKSAPPPFALNDILISINGIPLSSTDQLEFITDSMNPGDKVSVITSRNGVYSENLITLRKFYDNTYVAAVSFIGLSFFILAFLVLSGGSEKKASLIFHWGSISTALILFCTWGNIFYLPYNLGYIIRYIFHAGYVAAPAIFIHFALVFPIDRSDHRKKIIYFFYCTGLVVFTILCYTFTLAANDLISLNIKYYLYASNVLRIYVISGVIISVIIFARSYLLASNTSEKKKLKWILFGFVSGPLLYILTWVVPQALRFNFIPEIAAIFFMVFVPVTFSIAILKYHLFDIDLVINRSVVYSITVAFLIALYFIIVFLASDLLADPGNNFPSILSVIAAAILFQPVKTKVQKFVDKRFFKVQYDFRNAVRQFYYDLKQTNDFNSLSELVINATDKIIPLSRSGIIHFDPVNKMISQLYQKDFAELELEGALYKLQQLIEKVVDPAAYHAKLENGISINNIDKELYILFKIVIIIPIRTGEGKGIGYFVLGEKKSGSRFSIEDVEMLRMIGMRTSLEINRIKLNQELVYEHRQREKLQQLDELKSFFISCAAHELKTPLTSIKLFSEILEKKTDVSGNNYIKIIDGECDRLSRLIDNLLDMSKIERNERKYYPEPVFLVPLLRKSLMLMEYQFNKHECSVMFDPGEDEGFMIYADQDAVISALINLYSNAIKYSREPKKIFITFIKKENFVSITVKDNGIGINEDDIKNILQPYYRSTLVKNKNFIGTGIGLALVKHIVEGNAGTILISSKPGEGSSFILNFPLYIEEHVENEERITS